MVVKQLQEHIRKTKNKYYIVGKTFDSLSVRFNCCHWLD